jgi:arginase
MAPTRLIGVPIDSVGRSGGTELAPAALRGLGIVPALGATDGGDLEIRIRGEERDPETGIVGSEDVLAATSVLRASVADAIGNGELPLLLGGCCAELPGALAGARDALGRVGLAYLDGHLDLYDGVTSPTGEAADMPVGVALGLGPRRWVEAAGGLSVGAPDMALIGFRDKEESLEYQMLQPEELDPEPIHLSVDAVRVEGPAAVGKRVARSLSDQAPFWLHLDVDVLDQGVFAATDYLMSGGMTWGELAAALGPLASSPALAGASLACYNPEKDPGRECGRALVETVSAAFGD